MTNPTNLLLKILKHIPRNLRSQVIKAGAYLIKNHAKSLKSPTNLALYITNRCNANCKHCFYSSELNIPRGELKSDNIKKIAKSLRHPLRTLMITGGEPFLRNDVFEICKIFLENNKTKRITIDTNCILKEKILEASKNILKLKKGILHIQLSLDGFKDTHNKIKGVKCYKSAISTLKELEALQKDYPNLHLSIMTTISKTNYTEMIRFAKMIASTHPSLLHKFNLLRGSNLGTFNLQKDLTSKLDTKELPADLNELEKLFSNLGNIASQGKDNILAKLQRLKWNYSLKILKEKKKAFECMAGYSFGVIFPNGDVTICEPIKPFANLNDFDFDFAKLWNSKAANETKQKTRNCFCIHPCNVLDSISYDHNALLKLVDLVD